MTLSEEDIQASNSTQCPAAKLFQTAIYTTTARVFMVLVKFVRLVLDPPRQVPHSVSLLVAAPADPSPPGPKRAHDPSG